jgi:hypothetical protein
MERRIRQSIKEFPGMDKHSVGNRSCCDRLSTTKLPCNASPPSTASAYHWVGMANVTTISGHASDMML